MLGNFFNVYNILYNEDEITIDPITKQIVIKNKEDQQYQISKIQSEELDLLKIENL